MEALLVKVLLAAVGGAALYGGYLVAIGVWYVLFGQKKEEILDQTPPDSPQASATVLGSKEAPFSFEPPTSAGKKWILSVAWLVVAMFLLGLFAMLIEPQLQRWMVRMLPLGKFEAFAYAFTVTMMKAAILAVPLWWIWRTKKQVDTELDHVEAQEEKSCLGAPSADSFQGNQRDRDVIAPLEAAPTVEAIMRCVRHGDIEGVTHLIAITPQLVNAQSPLGNTPLHTAAERGFTELISLLISRGASLDCPNKYGVTARQILIGSGFAVTSPSDHGQSRCEGGLRSEAASFLARDALVRSAGTGKLSRTRQLLAEMPSIVELRDSGGLTALHHAATVGNVHLAKLLIQSGAKVDQRDHDGRTALQLIIANDLHEALFGEQNGVTK